VTEQKKKIIALLMAIALVGCALIKLLGSSGEQSEQESRPGPATAYTTYKAGQGEAMDWNKPAFGGLFANDSSFSTNTNDSSLARELFFRAMFAVLLVVVLGATAIYITRRFLPRITQGGALDWIRTAVNGPGKQIRILETAHLGPKKALHLIEIVDPASPNAKQRLLIGSTNENIRTLAFLGTDLVEDLSEFSSQEIENLDQNQAGNVRI
jgi:flagellar biogenesis protein FliO